MKEPRGYQPEPERQEALFTLPERRTQACGMAIACGLVFVLVPYLIVGFALWDPLWIGKLPTMPWLGRLAVAIWIALVLGLYRVCLRAYRDQEAAECRRQMRPGANREIWPPRRP